MLPSIFGENLFDDFFNDFDMFPGWSGRNPLYLKDGYLTISAAKGLDKDEKDKEGRYIRQERYAGACSRSFYVGDVKPEDVSAKYEDGILKLSMPKQGKPELPKRSTIAIA